MPDAFARDRSFWVQLGWGLFAGLLGGLGTLLFVAVMNLGIGLVWPEAPGPEPFSGSVRILVIMTLAGLIVGLIHRFAEAEEIDVFGAILKGKLEPRPIPAALLVALMYMIVAGGGITGSDFIILGLGVFADMASYFGSYAGRGRVPYGDRIPTY